MIKVPKEASDLARKQEEGGGNDHDSPSKYYEKERALLASSSTTTSSSMIEPQWVRLQDPRIVRVARGCGGKDRHSKVCTIRGLRDRRVRLSVTTAIQLYDLQERLGLNQPSKVIDWLLHAAKNDIDQLPPLPPLNLPLVHHHHHAILTSNSPPNQEEDDRDHDVKQQVTNNDDDHNELSHPRHHHHLHHHHNPSIVGYHGEGVHVSSHETDLQSLNVVPFSSTLSLSTADSSHHHHNFASQHYGGNMDMDDHNHILPRQVNYNNNHYPAMMMSSSSNLYHPIPMAQSLKPFGLSMMTPNNNTTTTTTTDQSQSHNHLQNFPSNK